FSSIRTKLLLIVLIPSLAMMALGVRQIVSEASEVRELEQTTQIVSLFDSVPPAIDALGRFRLEMVRSATPPQFGSGTARAAVTDALNGFQERAASLASEGSGRFQAALAKASGLSRAVDLSVPSPKSTDIEAAIDGLTELAGVTAFEVPGSDMSRS